MPRDSGQWPDRNDEQGRSPDGHPNPRRQGRMSVETRNEPGRDVRPGGDYKRYGMENEDWRHLDNYWRTMYGDSYPHEKEWNRGGRVETHSGRVPRIYKPIDDRIQEDIHERLMQHPTIDATGVGVSVHDGEVVLRGAVEGREMKRLAEEVVESVSGVKDVRNEIKVRKTKRHEGKRAA